MSALRWSHSLMVAALAAIGIAFAALAPVSDAQAAVKADGITVRACSGKLPKALSIFVHRVGCTPALHMVDDAASADRACPRGWRAKGNRRLVHAAGHSGKHRVTVCVRGRGDAKRAFTYHLPVG